jgi:hypothetical protein
VGELPPCASIVGNASPVFQNAKTINNARHRTGKGDFMSIVPASRLSTSDLALLGNNVVPARKSDRQGRSCDGAASRQILAAAQRSLASVGESDTEFYPTISTGGGRRGL